MEAGAVVNPEAYSLKEERLEFRYVTGTPGLSKIIVKFS